MASGVGRGWAAGALAWSSVARQPSSGASAVVVAEEAFLAA